MALETHRNGSDSARLYPAEQNQSQQLRYAAADGALSGVFYYLDCCDWSVGHSRAPVAARLLSQGLGVVDAKKPGLNISD